MPKSLVTTLDQHILMDGLSTLAEREAAMINRLVDGLVNQVDWLITMMGRLLVIVIREV